MAYRPSEGRNQKQARPPEQPNLVPIMNLFITIIPFLLTMIVVSQLALIALNFSATGGGGESGNGGGSGPDKEIKVIIMASEGKQMFPGFEVREEGAGTYQIKNSENSGRYNFLALDDKLRELKDRNTTINSISVVVYPDVIYESLIQTIDLCKQNGFPNVLYKPAGVGYGTGG